MQLQFVILASVTISHSLVTAFQDMGALKLPVIEKILRPILVYCVLIILLRVFGKRELAQSTPFDLVVLLSISNTVQNAIIGDDNSVLGGVVGAISLFGINYMVVRFLFQHPRLDQLLAGSPSTLVRHGQVNQEAMRKELITRTDLLSIAHRQGFETLDELEVCELEPGGSFFMKGRSSTSEAERHEETTRRLDRIESMVSALSERVN